MDLILGIINSEANYSANSADLIRFLLTLSLYSLLIVFKGES